MRRPSRVHDSVLRMLERGGMLAAIGAGDVFWSADQAIVAAEQRGCRHCQATAIAIDPPQLAPAAAH